MKRVLTLCALVLCFTAMAQKNYFKTLQSTPIKSSDMVEWRLVGPGNSGYCEKYWIHPADDNVMFQSPDMFNCYGTWDGGKTWQTIKDCDGDGVDMRRVQAITFSHQNPNFGMAITVTGTLYKTNDMGRSWQLDKNFESKGRCSVLTVDPTDDKVWYMGSGDFWNVKFNHRTKASLEDPTKGVFGLYVRYGCVLRSTDGGKSWREITKGLPEMSVKQLGGNKKINVGVEFGEIIVDPTNNKNVIAVTNYGVYRSQDQGLSWAPSGKGLPNDRPRDMDYYYDKKSGEFTLYLIDQTNYSIEGGEVSCTGGVFKSTDHGASWSSITGNLAIDMSKITLAPYINKYMNAVSFYLGMKSSDFAKEYRNKRPTSIMPVWNRIRVNPSNPNEIYVADNLKHDKSFSVGDVWKSEDGGKTWFATSRATKYWLDEKDKEYWQSRNNPLGVNVKFAHLQPTFVEAEVLAGNRILELNSRGDVFIGIDQQTLRSNDGGKKFEQVDDYALSDDYWVGRGDSNLPGRKILLDTGVEDRIFLCSGEHGLWMSTPRPDAKDPRDVAVKQIEGQKNHRGAHSIADVAVDPKDPNIIYTLQFRQTHRGALRRSIDGGETWENVSQPLVSESNISEGMLFQNSLTVDPSNSDIIYFAVMSNAVTDVSYTKLANDFTGFGVYKSTDKGLSFKMMNQGLPVDGGVHRVVLDPKNPKRLYAALNGNIKHTANGGLYLSNDGAESWKKVAIPASIKAVNHVSINPKDGAIYISCGTEYSTLDEGGVWRSTNSGKSWEKIFDMPYVWICESSSVDPNIITVSVPIQHRVRGSVSVNPGAYLSQDGGKSWNKINHNLGQPDKIVEIRPDNRDPKKLWCAQFGSGWAVGYIR